MAIEELNKETFQAAKELSEVQVALSTGRAALDNLKNEEESYYQVREKEVESRISSFLKTISEVFVKINGHVDVLRKFKTELLDFSNNVYILSEKVSEYSEKFRKYMEMETSELDKRHNSLQELKLSLDQKEKEIEESRIELSKESIKLANEKHALLDKRAAFDRAYSEMESKKQK